MRKFRVKGCDARRLATGAAAAVAVVLAASAASATAIVDFTVGTCQSANCDSIELGGRVSGASNQAGPWTIEVLAGLNECLRLQILSRGPPNLEMIVISPDGLVYRRNALVKFAATERGNYTVSISQRDGAAPNSRFRFAYGRYSVGNDNCADPTVPF